jgi:hypothetical protein
VLTPKRVDHGCKEVVEVAALKRSAHQPTLSPRAALASYSGELGADETLERLAGKWQAGSGSVASSLPNLR